MDKIQTVFINQLKPLLDVVAKQMDLYVHRQVDSHFVFERYDTSAAKETVLNNIRACTPIKEFLFPLRELAAVFPEPAEPAEIKPYAVFGLKDCDLRSLAVLDKVFLEDEFEDPLYVRRRSIMFIISSDCFEPAKSCFCNVMGGKPFSESGFDLNISQIKGGFLVDIGSEKGKNFVEKNEKMFSRASKEQLEERDQARAKTQQQLQQINSEYKFDIPVHEIVEKTRDSSVYDQQARTCIECQACTRVCPTCHCFYLYDTKQKDYFSKMKMWDGCMRLAYARVAGGENPRKVLGDRLRHRFMHKFSYFLERYGLQMCIGCGRCIDAEAGDVFIRNVLKLLYNELTSKGKSAQ
jgi:sulfhydrogenase subunit beta (sulfur reductase)